MDEFFPLLLVVACGAGGMLIARKKGIHPVLGAIVGVLLNLIGIAILLIVPVRVAAMPLLGRHSVNSDPSVPVARTPEERRAILANAIQSEVARGARIDSQSETMAVLIYGRRVNHILHFLVGIFTFGFWWLVWLALAIFAGESRAMVSVDEFGNVLKQGV